MRKCEQPKARDESLGPRYPGDAHSVRSHQTELLGINVDGKAL